MKTVLSAIFAVALLCTAVVAQEEKCENCPASKAAAATSAVATDAKAECCKEGQCPVETAMAKLPKMTYRVGTENTCCADSAAKMAEEKKAEAYTSLVEQTETMVNKFVTPCKCETSGTTTIAGASCKCPVEAGKKTELVSAAIKDIKMSYTVGEETCNCPTKASEMAKAAKTEMKYVVAGESTCCSLDARHKLAVAKYKAAVKALAVATPAAKPAATPATTATSTSGS